MFDGLADEIESLIEEQGRDLKFKIKDKLLPLNFNCTPTISYDYLLLDSNNEFSFLNPEINLLTSEDFTGLSDSHIYFKKVQEVCNNNFKDLSDDNFFFQIISPNRKLKELVDFIFSQRLQADQIPPFIEIKLYTNKNSDKAPRIFGFIGNANIIYILLYDPFHKVFSAMGKI